MKRNERDHWLESFCLYVEHGRQPPDKLMQFIAGGVREFLDHGRPWQLGKGGRPKRPERGSTRRQVLQAFALSEIGCTPYRVAELMGWLTIGGEDYADKVRNHIKDGQGIKATAGGLEYRWAIESLLTVVKPAERDQLAALLQSIEHDDPEPVYRKN